MLYLKFGKNKTVEDDKQYDNTKQDELIKNVEEKTDNKVTKPKESEFEKSLNTEVETDIDEQPVDLPNAPIMDNTEQEQFDILGIKSYASN